MMTPFLELILEGADERPREFLSLYKLQKAIKYEKVVLRICLQHDIDPPRSQAC
jgi:hypothetical protein